MVKTIEQAVRIDKAEIPYLHFPKEDVIQSSFDKQKRLDALNKALSLGNLDHFKVKIYFQDIAGLKQVETTIWGLTTKSVILKKGVVIPIARISEIEFI